MGRFTRNFMYGLKKWLVGLIIFIVVTSGLIFLALKTMPDWDNLGNSKSTASSLTEGFDRLNCNMNMQDIKSILGEGKAWTWDGVTNQPLGFVYQEDNLKLLYYGDTNEGMYRIIDIRLIQIDSNTLLKIKKCL